MRWFNIIYLLLLCIVINVVEINHVLFHGAFTRSIELYIYYEVLIHKKTNNNSLPSSPSIKHSYISKLGRLGKNNNGVGYI